MENKSFVCDNCGALHNGTYGSGRFCSEKCSRSFSTKRDNKKELKEAHCVSCNSRIYINKRATEKTCMCETCKQKTPGSYKLQRTDDSYKRICVICGKVFTVKHDNTKYISKRKTCSQECRHKLFVNIGKNTYKKVKESGNFVGWKTRNIISYAETFWINVLNNNGINYVREKYVLKYFLDFYIEKHGLKIDLEIDGKQHKYKDRLKHDNIRDGILKSNGFIVYRIDWNEIVTDTGKMLMKTKIDKFLNFYNSL